MNKNIDTLRRRISLAPSKAAPPIVEVNVPKPVCLHIDHLPSSADHVHSGGGMGQLAKLVSTNTLPLAVRVSKSFPASKGSSMSVKHGEVLLLCCLVDMPVVEATFSWEKNEEYRLPVYAKQMYTRLPLDPAFDDKEYEGTKALIESRPGLPKQVRVVDAVCSTEPMEMQDPGDVITIKGVDFQDHPERGKERVVVGVDHMGKDVRFPESMDLSSYTTMVGTDPLPLSELVKLGMPQRARLHDDTKKKDKAKQKSVTFHRYSTEKQVIAARSKHSMVMSFPIHADLHFEIVHSEDVLPMLPAIFSRTNFTWCVSDALQTNKLPENFHAIPQPQEGILGEWSKSYEGDFWISEKQQKTMNSYKDVISEKQHQVHDLTRRLELLTIGPKPPPHVAKRNDTVVGKTPPPLPPRDPKAKRSSLPAIGFDAEEHRHKLRLPRKVGNTKENHYDTPPPRPDINKMYEQAQETIQQLTKKLHEKDEEIFKLRTAERALKETKELLVKEKDRMKDTIDTDRAEIVRLRRTIDKQQNANIYEGIDDDVDEKTYSTPYKSAPMRSLEKMTIEETCQFIKSLGLEKYVKAFEREGIDGSFLVRLDEGILVEDIGMRRLDARKLMTRTATK